MCRGPPGNPETAPVRRNDVPGICQFVDDELECQPGVTPAVQEDQQRLTLIAPLMDVIVDAADPMPARSYGNAGLVF